jgi:hypothetical protein
MVTDEGNKEICKLICFAAPTQDARSLAVPVSVLLGRRAIFPLTNEDHVAEPSVHTAVCSACLRWMR